MGLLPVEKDISKLLFEGKRAQHACRLLLDELKLHDGLTRHELSRFAFDLAKGKLECQYSRSRFYSEIRRTLISTGLLSLESRFVECQEMDLSPERKKHRSLVNKYVPVRQPIPRRPPDGLNLPRLIWIVCERWNRTFFEEA